MGKSVLEATQVGEGELKPQTVGQHGFAATNAEPGSAEKLAVLAGRIRQGLPLWHPDDRRAEDALALWGPDDEG